MSENRQMLAANARAKALEQLINTHADEWARLLGDAREAQGLTRTSGTNALAAENLRLRRRLAELEGGDA